jgi:chitinase
MKQKTMRLLIAFVFLQFIAACMVQAQQNGKAVIAYYAGSAERLDSFDANSMTHIIYCFGHLGGNRLKISSAKDTLLIRKMVAMKKENPQLKVLLSLGGWGGCEPCSAVFNTKEGREEFAQSVKELNSFFGADGIDLDWEYPTVPGYPGHQYLPEDKQNFTALVKELRQVLGAQQLITFAAGGFQKYLDEAVDWNEVMPYVDYVNLMTYDLVSGYSKMTGHHTALYSTPSQKESTNNCVQYLLKKGVESSKLILGAAFYGRVWEGVPPVNNGLYQSGKFKSFVGFKDFPRHLSDTSGYVFYWDDAAKAPYAYNASQKLYATFDDKRSMALKTEYVLRYNLGGIMFWQLGDDKPANGLLQTINETLKGAAGAGKQN